MECGAGARIEQPSRVLHHSGNCAYHSVFGFSRARNVATHLQASCRVGDPVTFELKKEVSTNRRGVRSISPGLLWGGM
jgi:hypothetical protein